MYKLFSVGIFSTHIKHTVMSDCFCSKVITTGIMEHLSANNQKTLNVMSSLLKPFSSSVQGYMNIEGVWVFFLNLRSTREITHKVVQCESQVN